MYFLKLSAGSVRSFQMPYKSKFSSVEKQSNAQSLVFWLSKQSHNFTASFLPGFLFSSLLPGTGIKSKILSYFLWRKKRQKLIPNLTHPIFWARPWWLLIPAVPAAEHLTDGSFLVQPWLLDGDQGPCWEGLELEGFSVHSSVSLWVPWQSKYLIHLLRVGFGRYLGILSM